MQGQGGIETAHGVAGFLALCVLLLLLFHFAGFRAIVTVGRGA